MPKRGQSRNADHRESCAPRLSSSPLRSVPSASGRTAGSPCTDSTKSRILRTDSRSRLRMRKGRSDKTEIPQKRTCAKRQRESVRAPSDSSHKGPRSRGVTFPRLFSCAAHKFAAANFRRTSVVSMAASAASMPLLPALPPARSSACSIDWHVSTPKVTGTPLERLACRMPPAI